MGFGVGEWLVIGVIVLVLFGATKLPALGQGLGKAVKNFKDASRAGESPPKDLPPPEGGGR